MAAQWVTGLLRRLTSLTEVTSPASTDVVPIISGGTVKKIKISNILPALDAVTYKGATDCSGNPNYPAADAGDLYIVSVAGKIGGASGVSVEVGDMFICKTDGTLAGTQAQRGTAWNVVQSNLLGPIPVKATGAEIVTGTDDAKFATAKAIKDAGITPGGGGITNSAGANVVPKSDGTNLVASRITDDASGIEIDLGATDIFKVAVGPDPTLNPQLLIDGNSGFNLESILPITIGDYSGNANHTYAEVKDSTKEIELTASTESLAIDGVAHTITLQAANGVVIVPPTADPHIVGALWNNAGTLVISAG